MANGKSVGDARFYTRSGPYNIAEVAAAWGCAASSIGPDEVSFLDNRRYASVRSEVAGQKAALPLR